ncbi:MAG: basic amino acid/polyamine antiporter [Sarcina sp.]
MKSKKLGLFGLVMLVMGGVIGGGIFSLPSQLAQGAGLYAILIGFLVSGIGIFSLGFVYAGLSNKKPELKNGIYRYSKVGFGSYMGFNAAWIYWLSSTFGNAAYATLVFGSMAYFFNIFNPNGNNLAPIIAASILIWLITILILRGVRQAIIVNSIVTVSKIIPILVFIIIGLVAMHINKLHFQFYGTSSLGSVFHQVKNTMIATLWAFGGIEAAVVLSGRAKKTSDVAKATIIGLIGIISIYVLVVVISFGVLNRPTLAGLQNPSMAYILQAVVGKWGAVLINITLIISILGALLGWTVIISEMPYSTSKDNLMPKFLQKENKNGVAIWSLILTTGFTQLWLLFSYFFNNSYQNLYSIASTATLIPYFLSALYFLKVTIKEDLEKAKIGVKIKDSIVAIVSVVYTVWLVYAADIKYILLNLILFAAGLILYAWNKKERKEKLFERNYEWIIAFVIVIGAIIAIYLLATGKISAS